MVQTQAREPLVASKYFFWPANSKSDLFFIYVLIVDTIRPARINNRHIHQQPLYCPQIFFAFTSLALSCFWEMLQDLCSHYLPILLTLPLSPTSHFNKLPLSSNFQKACEDDSASRCRPVKEYFTFPLFSAAALFVLFMPNCKAFNSFVT